MRARAALTCASEGILGLEEMVKVTGGKLKKRRFSRAKEEEF
jgi:hypothetical protein